MCFFDNNVQRTVVPLVKPHNFMHQDDYLVLEDESGRVKLGGNPISPSVYVTGLYMFPISPSFLEIQLALHKNNFLSCS